MGILTKIIESGEQKYRVGKTILCYSSLILSLLLFLFFLLSLVLGNDLLQNNSKTSMIFSCVISFLIFLYLKNDKAKKT